MQSLDAMAPPLARRQLLLGLGASLLAAPFTSLLRTPARADGGKRARRLLVFFSPNGTVHAKWRPTGGETDFAFPKGSILEPLAKRRGDLVVLDGVDFKGFDNHEPGMNGMLTGQGTLTHEGRGASVDQYVASKIGAATRFPSLELGVQTSAWGGSRQTRMCYAAPDTFVPPEDSPKNAWTRLFGDLGKKPGEVDATLARRKSVLDVVRADLADLRARVGVTEQHKLDDHLEAIRAVEKTLTTPVAASCTAPVAPIDLALQAHENFPALGRTQSDLAVLALACGLTNVASIQWTHTVSPTVFSWLGIGDGHHELSHKPDENAKGVADFVAAERWFAEQFLYVLDKLAAIPEPDGSGTLLDTTLVVWAKELGDGRLHDAKSVPFVLAGRAGGALRTGRYLRYPGEPHQRLLVSICQAMGLTNLTFGDPSHGAGPLGGLLG